MRIFESTLLNLADKKYALFQAKLIPTIDEKTVIGVRVPILRKFAKEVYGSSNARIFLSELPHHYYDENMLHALMLSLINNFDEVIVQIDRFLTFVDNWAVCDIMNPKVLGEKENLSKLFVKIKEWIASENIYTIRFGIKCLMDFYLDENFQKEYLEIPAKIKSKEYYVNMMIAWFYVTSLCKQWEDTIIILENKILDKMVHNKTIQKAVESYRITDKQKEYLRKLRI